MTEPLFDRWKRQARELKRDVYAVYLACRDPRVPWHVKAVAAVVVAYAFSPIDLIPDFIPVLGYLDDLLLVPLGIALVLKMLPADVMQAHREKANADIEAGSKKPVNYVAAGVIVLLWLAGAWLFATWAWRFFAARTP